jgi:aminopeptidase N
VVSVETRCVDNKTTEVDLSMSRFVGVPGAPREDQTWTLPVCLKNSSGQPRCEVIERPKQAVRLNGCDKGSQTADGPAAVFANSDSRGYYFTEYSPEVVRSLARSSKMVGPVERLGLLGDEWWMVRAGRHDVSVYLDVAGAFATDNSSAVTRMLVNRLANIGEDLVLPTERPAYQAWIRTHFGQQLNTLGLPGNAKDSDEVQMRRATLLELIGIAGDDHDVQKRSRELAIQYLKDSHSLPATIAPTVLRVAAIGGDRALYDQYLARLGTLAAQPEEYYRFLNALPWFKDAAMSKRTLEYALSPAVRTQDTGYVLGTMMVMPWSQDMSWEFVQTNWPTIVKTLGEFQGIPAIVESSGGFCSASRAREVRTFFEKNPVPSSQRGIQQAIERIENCAALKERQAKPLSAWISANAK